eukprot:TRINITY_DN3030_c0_g1_i1.p1 TRINITY_DN3030_c0_g1~~TRINITY_DN3030_c0_g1_i1.p1  ORF type:complete len:144 (-),score=52.21 TRINITY_DN3030_c0_g1_i1:250-618(-)
MKLYTHNMMISPVKGITKNYPLGIEADSTETRDVDFDAQFIKHILPTIDYPVLLASALQLNYKELPEMVNYDEENEEVLKKLHHALFNLEVITGRLVCPESGRKYPIINGIPNLLLKEDEVA